MKQVLFNLLLAFFISAGVANAVTNTVHDKPLKAIPGNADETYVWDTGTSTLKKTTFAPFLVGDCTGFPCLDGTSDGGNYIKLWAGTGSYWTALQGGSPAANRSWRLPIAAPPATGTTYLMNMDEYGQMGFVGPSTFVASDNGTVISPRIQRVVRNVTGSTLLAGRYVYQVGASGQTPTVAYADKDIYANSHVIGKLVSNIANNATGYMTISGGTWVGDSSAFVDGDELYLGDDGQATSTSPVTGFEVAVGHVNYANPATGRISVDIQHPTEGGGYTNLTEFVGQTAWRLFYSDGSGDVKELTLGSDGEYLKSNGAALAPTWATPSGAAHDAVTLGTDADAILGLSTQQITLDSQTANTVFAAPNGSAGDPTFRALVASDIPTLNQSTTGNAATATALQVARTIGGVSFDGSANISLPGVNASGTQDTTGNAATATALASNPTDCTAGQYATTIAANGDLTCAQVGYSQVSGTPTIPTALSDFTDDTTHRLVTDTQIGTWNAKQNAISAGTDYLAPAGIGASLTFTATGFNGNLATTINTVQELADAVDDLPGGTDDQTAAEVSVADTAGHYTATNVETVLAEIGAYPLIAWGTGLTETVGSGTNTISVTPNTYQAYDANMILWPSAISVAEVGYLDGLVESVSTSFSTRKRVVVSNSSTLATTAIPANTCSIQSFDANGTVAATDKPDAYITGRLSTITGFGVTSAGSLRIDVYLTDNNINFDVCNPTSAAITPGALTIKWDVLR